MSQIIIGSYNMSFASGLGLDPQRVGVYESEGNFLLKNKESQQQNILFGQNSNVDYKKYWMNALAHLEHFIKNKKPAFIGFQEMNIGSENDKGTAQYACANIKNNQNGQDFECVIDKVTGPNNTTVGIMSIFDKQIFGNLKISKCYELGEGDGAFGIGRPLLIILTDKNYLLINLHAPNKQDDSLNNYDIIKKRIENKINEFLQNNSIEIPEKNIFVVGDFNDRYNGLNKNRDTQNKAYNELSLVLKGKKVPLTFNGEAPKSCCYNWDSSCSDKRKNIYKGNSKAVTCNTTEDIVLAGPDNNIKKRKSMSDEGNLNNYRYTGDYCFGYTPTDILQIYNPENRTVSNESDHELVYAGFEIDSSEQDVVNNVTGGKRKTEKISKRRTRKQKKYSKMYSKKRCHKLMKRCGCKH